MCVCVCILSHPTRDFFFSRIYSPTSIAAMTSLGVGQTARVKERGARDEDSFDGF